MKRDLLLDNLRALAMIDIICIIHVIHYFNLANEYIHSFLLFIMPTIFFIAGASQSLVSQSKTIKNIIISRSKRILIPFFIFIIILYIWITIATFLPLNIGLNIDITQLSTRQIIKTLCTGGCDNIPFYGYTWFISIYLIVSISLPIQRKIIENINKYVYILLWISIVVVLSFIKFPLANIEIEVKNIVIYNVFYIIGFCCYKQIDKKITIIVSIITVTISIYGFISHTMIPMQSHKFPADYLFLIYGITWISTMSLILNFIKQKEYRLLTIWNKNGYYLYLYQTITFSTIVWITYKWIELIKNNCIKFLIYFTICFILNTLLAYFMQWVILCYNKNKKTDYLK